MNEKNSLLKNKKKLLAAAKEEEQKMEKGVHDISSKEEKLKELSLKEKELFSKVNSMTEIIKLKKEELGEFKSEHSAKEQTLLELEKSRASIQLLEKTINVLARMREDIRNIRETIRKNFLEDFRQEFQKKFEEIRKYEEEYTVDIKTDYEPIAYTQNGEEVPIANLSGGEKTSVALAYRLALADLAAQVSAIKPSEILILDEPTIGFDQEDIKALPQALRNIQTIPQIIIVTHEEELKNAADYKYQITKQGNESTINRAD
jgi:exonuclease SbcC